MLLDDFIAQGEFHEFSRQILKRIADEMIEEKRWQMYLHKVYGNISYSEYIRELESGAGAVWQQYEMTDGEKRKVIAMSEQILERFEL